MQPSKRRKRLPPGYVGRGLKSGSSEYVKVHKELSRLYPKQQVCELCGKQGKTDWASKSHARYTLERSDWLEACRSCHRIYDGIVPTEAIQSNAGRSPSLETRAKIGAAHRGKTVSAETRAKLSEAAKKRKLTPAHKEALRRAAQRPKSAETRAKMAAAARARYADRINE